MTGTTPTPSLADGLKAQIKKVVCDILEVDEDEVTEFSLFKEEFDMDSLRAIEIVAALEKRLGLTVEEEQAKDIVNLAGVYKVLGEAAQN